MNNNQKSIEIAKNANYQLKIYIASGNNKEAINATLSLIKDITAIYKYIEPSHINGKLIVYRCYTNIGSLEENVSRIYNMDDLTHISNNDITIESRQEQLYLIPKSETIKDKDTLAYCYEKNHEYFIVNGMQIEIPHTIECSSIYALQYADLNDALKRYANERISTSNCEVFKKCWLDTNRIFFNPAPEEQMQISLKEFLSSALRGVEVVREYNLGASKPVDIRVKWTEANKSALIELKWLGKSKNGNNLTVYTDSRANDGSKQLKEYLDMDNTDTPNIISKAYLVVIDGRRRNTNENTSIINSEDGLYYENQEINFSDEHKYFERLKNFAPPIRMFAKPILS